ncbi:acetyltransferase (GNAT) family protein [Balneicella halophila]|uniref:Acetyltransferase (GNAT) family protein n=1 Tax=Balneicella halophila TaxID=1537566 RepID=A0A7L4UQE7_BALHA|nr:GNAT family N-acetyltransferase [Balneicella halophila]PVX51899.1 acetyltransferase (GNAT) family protein [Balneicella halophila]
MIYKKTDKLSPVIRKEIRAIWNEEYPKVIIEKSQDKFDEYIKSLKDAKHVIVIDESGHIQGWYADFIRDDDRWFLILLSSKIQGKGIGKELITNARQNNDRLNGWAIFSNHYKKSDETLYKSPIAFYKKLGFTIRKDIIFRTEIMETVKIEWRKQ